MKLRKDKWQRKTLGEISTIIMGQSPPSSTYNEVGEGLPFFQGKTEFTDKYPVAVKWCSKPNKIAEPNDILITVRAPVGATNIANQKCCIGRGIAVIRSKESNDYILTFLQSVEKELSLKGTGTIFGGISGKVLIELPIPLPPLEEQKQIAALFQSIEMAMEQVDGQEKNLKALQKSLVNGLLSKEPEFGNLLNIKNCIATTFGEIAECDKKYPEHEKEVERFVGLEWIEADNFQLQGFGLVANGTTFTKRFVKGDVMFGKRRAYLKKVAVADFDGICSGDILVIRAKAKKMLQGLLPYYISADAFIQHAVSTSAGSLSPRTKWKDLADLEVSIPDPNTQSTILEVLQQLDKTVNQLKQQKTTLKNLKQKLLNEILG
jgi:type I restriction enzyme S subunit